MDTNPLFAPVEHRHRHDGWTADVQRAFIEQLALTGSVQRAAQLVGRSPSSAYRLRARPDASAFRAAWSAATSLAYSRLHELAMDRIVNGIEVPVFDADGNEVDRRVQYDNKLLMFMLTHLLPTRHTDFTKGETVTRLIPQRIVSDPAEGLAAALAALDEDGDDAPISVDDARSAHDGPARAAHDGHAPPADVARRVGVRSLA